MSLFASAVRPKLWPALFKSLENTSVSYEVVFAGNSVFDPGLVLGWPLKYVFTKNLKPSVCYEISRRQCQGEVIIWIADDCEFVGDIIGKAYRHWKSQNNENLILSLQTKESGYGCKDGKLYPMKEHTFYSLVPDSPLMAPLGLMSRQFANDLGGYDRRYISGQAENDLVMRAYQYGATVEIFGDETAYVDIDHLGKSIAIGESTDEETFRDRPFAKGYFEDRLILEKSWTTFDETKAFKRLDSGERPYTLRDVSPVQIDKFEPYSDPISLTKSEGNNLPERWE